MKSLKAVIGVLLVVAAFYAAWLLLPPYINNYQFQDDLTNEALINSYSNKSETGHPQHSGEESSRITASR